MLSFITVSLSDGLFTVTVLRQLCHWCYITEKRGCAAVTLSMSYRWQETLMSWLNTTLAPSITRQIWNADVCVSKNGEYVIRICVKCHTVVDGNVKLSLRLINLLQTNLDLDYLWFNSYRAVNTLPLRNKRNSANAVYGINLFLFRDPYKTHECTL
jgi:hypothetical protein